MINCIRKRVNVHSLIFYIHLLRSNTSSSPLSLVKLFTELGRQQAADSVIGEEHVEVPQEAALGFKRFIFCFQHLVGNNLEEECNPIRNKQQQMNGWCIHHWSAPLICLWLLSPPAASCRTSGSARGSCWVRLWWRGRSHPCQSAGREAEVWGNTHAFRTTNKTQNDDSISSGLTCGSSEPVGGFSKGWTARWSSELRPKAASLTWIDFLERPAEPERLFSPGRNTNIRLTQPTNRKKSLKNSPKHAPARC